MIPSGNEPATFRLEAFWPPYGLRVYSVSNRNEYQEYFLGVKVAGAQDWVRYHLHVPIVLKSGSLTLLEPSGPVQACNGFAIYIYIHTQTHTHKIPVSMQLPNTLKPDRQHHEHLRRMLPPRSILPKPALSFPQRKIRRAFQVSLFQFLFKHFFFKLQVFNCLSLTVCALYIAQCAVRQQRHLYLHQKPLLLTTWRL